MIAPKKRTVLCKQCNLFQFETAAQRCRRCRSDDLTVRDELFARVDPLPTLEDVRSHDASQRRLAEGGEVDRHAQNYVLPAMPEEAR